MKSNEGLGIILYIIVIIQLVTMMNYLIFRAKKAKLLYSFLTCNIIETMWSLFAIFENLACSKERRQYGFMFNVLTAYNNISIISGVLIVIAYSLKRYKKVNFENIIMIVIVLIPFTIYILMLFEVIPSPGFDITQISFSVSLFLCSIAIYKYRFLDILPTAYKELVSNLNELVIFANNQDMVLYYNESFKLAFKNIAKVDDTMGRTMTLLISMIELENSKKETSDNNLIEIMNVAKKGYAQLRYSIQGLAVKNRQWDDFVESIQRIIDEFLISKCSHKREGGVNI